jgi:hypothetical protein
MNICDCALPAINGNSDCCKNCPNNRYDETHKSQFIWTTINDKTILPDGVVPASEVFDWSGFYNNLKIKPMIDVVKENIEGLTIKELKELMEYMKKFEGLK